ncbi:MmcQ/YjbR family DNA-binding protein [Paenibacillus athensensis]|uniref:Phosphoribosylglycinamide formyltransferase n=1 Tax=Paenibacillus athensensis TaxID=1967502 RepID=A0A4Y8Q9E6_9BACL|nr:MmcQ/YjbR family DNA-binding protein [Paenibacillus athensensis]MCD1259990.1 MmcQ/YjbR family DNA-binding protein [Paenibacillus athensensis]
MNTDHAGSCDSAYKDELSERIRLLCMSYPAVSERPSHGAPSFFIDGKRSFVQIRDNHHGDGRFALWCAAPEGLQSLLVDSNPELFYVPAYVGHLGWVGLRLDRSASWEEIEFIVRDAYLARASKKQQALLSGRAVTQP